MHAKAAIRKPGENARLARIFAWLAACASALWALAGCNPQPILEQLIPGEAIAFARGHVEHVRQRDFEAVTREVHPDLRTGRLKAEVETMAALFPASAPEDLRLVQSFTTRRGDEALIDLVFEYEYSDRFVLADVVVQPVGPGFAVRGVHVSREKSSREAANAFALTGKPLTSFLVLVFAIAVPLVMLVAAALAIRAPGLSFRWAWVAAILIGVAPVQVNWTTGSIELAPVGVQILGSAVSRLGSYAPVLITTSLPLVALIFLALRSRLGRPRGATAASA
jgi:hypothetical protein